MHKIYNIFKEKFEKLQLLQELLSNKIKTLTYVKSEINSFFSQIVYLGENTESGILAIVADDEVIDKIYSYLKSEFSSLKRDVTIFPSYNLFFYECNKTDREESFFRVEALNNLYFKNGLVLTTPLALLFPTISIENLAEMKIILHKDDNYDIDDFISCIIKLGFTRVEHVYDFGTFAFRGEVIDIFLHPTAQPVRIIFDGDRVEKIRRFEIDTSRIIEELPSIEILPISEFFITENPKNQFIDEIYSQNSLDSDAANYAQDLQNNELYSILWSFSKLSTEKKYLLNYVKYTDFVCTFDYQEVENIFELEFNNSLKAFKNLDLKGLSAPSEFLITKEDFKRFTRDLKNIYFMTSANSKIKDNVYCMNISAVEPFKNRFEDFRQIFEQRINDGSHLFFVTSDEEQIRRLSILFNKLKFSKIYDNILKGFYDELTDTYYYTPDELIEYRVHSKSSGSFQTEFIESTLDIKPGEYVVHIHHGIGIYEGLKRLNILNEEKDYIQIRYKNSEHIYLPIENIGLIQKYISFGSARPTLDSISNRSWKKTLARTREDILVYAQQLLELYEMRKSLKGIEFKKFDDMEKAFADSFEYKETYDQQKAIDEVLLDMTQPYPMDRLICGDVGFGKTEVAMRAAYRAVLNGYQVALICPTTILADQHYETFSKRMKQFGVTVGILSRLIPASTQDRYIRMALNGELDILIGTHRLLSKEVNFKKLGLLIIDEEHKFGVEHKDKFIKLKKDIDLLSLSATPIPRTLHMALSRIRPLSIINTAPEERVPVEVFVEPMSDEIIKRAINFEIQRGGKVFYVHNRVRTIVNVVMHLKKIFKDDLQITYAHGQMSEHELESNVNSFINGEKKILVSTSIIESGIDIPDVNTIIIDNAHLFGLSNLYQLKGRVGRRSRKAYAYLLYPEEYFLSEIALKRLQVIADYCELGSGYKVALKDLELRGAGNILGKEQSGFISLVGYHLYERLLDEAINKLQKKEKKFKSNSEVELQIKTGIPDFLGLSKKEKIAFYEELLGCEDEKDLASLKMKNFNILENAPVELTNLLTITNIRILCQKRNIIRILESKEYISVIFENANINIDKLMKYLEQKMVFVDQRISDKIEIVNNFDTLEKKINFLIGFIQEIFEIVQ